MVFMRLSFSKRRIQSQSLVQLGGRQSFSLELHEPMMTSISGKEQCYSAPTRRQHQVGRMLLSTHPSLSTFNFQCRWLTDVKGANAAQVPRDHLWHAHCPLLKVRAGGSSFSISPANPQNLAWLAFSDHEPQTRTRSLQRPYVSC